MRQNRCCGIAEELEAVVCVCVSQLEIAAVKLRVHRSSPQVIHKHLFRSDVASSQYSMLLHIREVLGSNTDPESRCSLMTEVFLTCVPSRSVEQCLTFSLDHFLLIVCISLSCIYRFDVIRCSTIILSDQYRRSLNAATSTRVWAAAQLPTIYSMSEPTGSDHSYGSRNEDSV